MTNETVELTVVDIQKKIMDTMTGDNVIGEAVILSNYIADWYIGNEYPDTLDMITEVDAYDQFIADKVYEPVAQYLLESIEKVVSEAIYHAKAVCSRKDKDWADNKEAYIKEYNDANYG